ncbi:hypothetical protein ACFXAW_05835 [Streptomyces sp. NPDC059445]
MPRHGIERLAMVDEMDRLVDIVSRRALLQPSCAPPRAGPQ